MNNILVLGASKSNGGRIVSLEDFSWSCGWYWSGGYLGNRKLHYHVESYFNEPRKNAFDAIKDDFGSSLRMTDNELWRFCDLFKQFYSYRSSAECFAYGGHYTSRGREITELVPEMADKINAHIKGVVIPMIQELCLEIKENQKS